jgi:hypothetical protein
MTDGPEDVDRVLTEWERHHPGTVAREGDPLGAAADGVRAALRDELAVKFAMGVMGEVRPAPDQLDRLAYWLAEQLAWSFRVEPRAAGTARYTNLVRRMLIGQPLVHSARAVDMEMFGFGKIVTLPRWSGGTRDVPRFALHVQCPWRIVASGRVVVGASDIGEPRSDHDTPDAFDPNVHGTTRREELLESLFSGRAGPGVVTDCELGEAGWLRVTMHDGSRLELFPDEAPDDRRTVVESEYWRLFEVGQLDTPSLVVSANGAELVGNDEERGT